MACDPTFVEFVLEQLDLGGRASCRKMFGEYALYLDGKVVALLCDDTVFLKITAAAESVRPLLPRGRPYPGAKEHLIVDELLDSPSELRSLVSETAKYVALPAPKRPKPEG